MAECAYITSSSTGHGSWPSRVTDDGSPNVLVNGNGVHRLGDLWPVHCNSIGECHAGATNLASATVLANGKGIARVGDSIDCGDSIATGSVNVLVGD